MWPWPWPWQGAPAHSPRLPNGEKFRLAVTCVNGCSGPSSGRGAWCLCERHLSPSFSFWVPGTECCQRKEAKEGKAGPGLGGTHLARRASCRSLGQTHWWLPLPKMVSAMLGAPSQRGASHLGEKGKKKERVTGWGAGGRQVPQAPHTGTANLSPYVAPDAWRLTIRITPPAKLCSLQAPLSKAGKPLGWVGGGCALQAQRLPCLTHHLAGGAWAGVGDLARQPSWGRGSGAAAQAHGRLKPAAFLSSANKASQTLLPAIPVPEQEGGRERRLQPGCHPAQLQGTRRRGRP